MSLLVIFIATYVSSYTCIAETAAGCEARPRDCKAQLCSGVISTSLLALPAVAVGSRAAAHSTHPA